MHKYLRSWCPVLTIVLGVFLANAVNVFLVDPNPALQKTNLGTDIVPGFISGLNTIDPFTGYITQALGGAVATQWFSGTIPWWNSFEGIGAPLAGGMQAAAFFPLVVLTSLSTGVLWMHIMLECIAGLATYALLIKLGIKRPVAVVGGLAFALNGTFAWLSNAVVNPLAFLPLLLLGMEYARQATIDKRSGGWILVFLATAGSLYAGFPEVAALNMLLAAAWYIARNIGLDRAERWRFAGKLSVGLLLGALVSLPQLVAFISYYPDANVGGHAAGMTESLPEFGVAGLLLPYVFGPIFGFADSEVVRWWGGVGGFLTVSLCFLAILGMQGREYRPLKITLLAVVIILVARIYGVPGLAQIFAIIPGMSAIAVDRYVFPGLEMAVIILAAFGMQAILTKTISRKQILHAVGVIFALVCVALLIALPQIRQLVATAPNYLWWIVLSVGWAAITVAAIVILSRIRKAIWSYGILLVVACDMVAMFTLPQLSAPRSGSVDTAPVTFLRQNLGTQRFFTLGPIAPNYGSYFGIASVNNNNLPVPVDWTDFVQKELDPYVEPSIHFTGDRKSAPETPSSLDMFLRNITAYEAVGTKYVVANPGQITDGAAEQAQLRHVFGNKTADIYELPNPAAYYEPVGDRNNCHIISQGRTRLELKCNSPAKLIRREMYMPGWKAEVNGRSVRVDRYKTIFQSTPVPSGKSTIVFSYRPPYIELAFGGAVTGALVAIYAAIGLRRWADMAARLRIWYDSLRIAK